ncbi:hypothetical protein [Streptomyces sp. NPDC097610]|uniref:hypothetical protein n=1 Tax=Streptomyces sp. NPDC097610 TaxID=3157227 RepID=UPI00331B97A8
MITLHLRAPAAPLTDWQRRERFATMRKAQRQAAALRDEAAFMRRYRTAYNNRPEDIRQVDDEAAMWEDLARWLGKSVRPK